MLRDPQRERLEYWEDTELAVLRPDLSAPISHAEVKDIVARLWGDWFYGHAPRVVFIGERKYASYIEGAIYLPPWACCAAVVAHEVAHAVVDRLVLLGRLHSSRDDGHGPVFASVYASTLDQSLGVSGARWLMTDFGLDVGLTGSMMRGRTS